MKRASWLVAFGLLAIVVAVPAQAQGKEVQGYIAGGYVQPMGDLDEFVGGGWNISGGAIFRPIPDRPFGVRVDLGYSSMDADSTVINNGTVASLFIDDGYVSMGNLTAEVMWEFGNPDGFGGYLAVGGGGYRRYGALTTDTTNYYCDPYWGCWYYNGSSIVADDSLIKWGWSVAAGAAFSVGSGQLYIEARYHWMMSSPSTQYLPVLLGYRF